MELIRWGLPILSRDAPILLTSLGMKAPLVIKSCKSALDALIWQRPVDVMASHFSVPAATAATAAPTTAAPSTAFAATASTSAAGASAGQLPAHGTSLIAGTQQTSGASSLPASLQQLCGPSQQAQGTPTCVLSLVLSLQKLRMTGGSGSLASSGGTGSAPSGAATTSPWSSQSMLVSARQAVSLVRATRPVSTSSGTQAPAVQPAPSFPPLPQPADDAELHTCAHFNLRAPVSWVSPEVRDGVVAAQKEEDPARKEQHAAVGACSNTELPRRKRLGQAGPRQQLARRHP